MTLKIISWNVNGLQGILKKNPRGQKVKGVHLDALTFLIREQNPDILCLQEIKCSDKFDHKAYITQYPYTYVNHCTSKKAYSGVFVGSKRKPLRVAYDFELLGDLDDDGLTKEGRMITLEFQEFFLVNVYVPNSGIDGIRRLEWRINVWDTCMAQYLDTLLASGKQVILIGDLNVVPTNLDANRIPSKLIRAITLERALFIELLKLGFIDSYRALHPTKRQYTWTWPRAEWMEGYRLDIALITPGIDLVSSDILNYLGSDHRPIMLQCQ